MIEALLYFFVLKSFIKGDYYHQIITLTLMLQNGLVENHKFCLTCICSRCKTLQIVFN